MVAYFIDEIRDTYHNKFGKQISKCQDNKKLLDKNIKIFLSYHDMFYTHAYNYLLDTALCL